MINQKKDYLIFCYIHYKKYYPDHKFFQMNRIKVELEKKGLTQTWLAEKFGKAIIW
jgi:hypothetical protein